MPNWTLLEMAPLPPVARRMAPLVTVICPEPETLPAARISELIVAALLAVTALVRRTLLVESAAGIAVS